MSTRKQPQNFPNSAIQYSGINNLTLFRDALKANGQPKPAPVPERGTDCLGYGGFEGDWNSRGELPPIPVYMFA